MALVKCPECGKKISENAKSCPNCGNPIKKIKRRNFGEKIANLENKIKSSKKLKLIIIFSYLFIVLIFIIVVYINANKYETTAYYINGLKPVEITTIGLCNNLSISKGKDIIMGIRGKANEPNRLNPGIVMITLDGGWWLTVPDNIENIDKVKKGTKISVSGKLKKLDCDDALITKFAYVDVYDISIIK